MSSRPSSERDGGASATTPGGIDHVREILFGAHFRDFERKLARVDAHLAAESEELRKEMRRRLEVLEAHLARESDALTARFESERSTHLDTLSKANREARDTIAALEQRVTRLEEALARAQRDLRQQILDQAKAFLDETRRTREEVVATLERELLAVEASEQRAGREERRDERVELGPPEHTGH